MIKIQIDEETKSNIADLHWTDMRSKKAGLYKSLMDISVIKLLQSKQCYNVLYCYFYDKTGNIIKENVKKLLLANKSQMEEYIKKFGKFNSIESDELQKYVFRYTDFSKRISAYTILKKMKVNVCPYCNRQYTFTLESNLIRPQFDHYFPKSLYPYLAVSIFNLIPSCSICNQAKGSLDTYNEPILYPYEEEFGEKTKFTIESNDIKSFLGMGENFNLCIDYADLIAESQDKVMRQTKVLHLEELYDMHKDNVCDIVLNHYINSNDRIKEILSIFPDLFDSEDEILKVLYMNDTRKDNWGKRPLAKLTYDINNKFK